MNYKEAVENKIVGKATELDRRKELWEKIANAYDQGGGDLIRSVLDEHSDSLTKEFDRLLYQLSQKL